MITSFKLRNPTNETVVVAERTICPILHILTVNASKKLELSIQIFTESTSDIHVSLKVTIIDFAIKLYDDRSFLIDMNNPVFFLYQFPSNVSSVSVTVKSDDDTCMILSIQNSVCPIYEETNDVKNGDLYQTVTKIGGIVVQNDEKFKNQQFFIALVVNENNDCHNKTKLINKNLKGSTVLRQKKVQIKIKPINKDYRFPVSSAIIFFLVFYIVYGIGLCVILGYSRNKIIKNSEIENLEISEEKWNLKHFVNLEFILIISFFYAIPVVQFFLFYNTTIDITGNQNICFYNSLCTRPMFGFITFNNIFSNIGYVVLGILFFIIVFIKQAFFKRQEKEIPLQYGIFYAIGAALIMEGIMSSCYHICPRLKNIQFDSTYMYIMASLVIFYYVLSIMKITVGITYFDIQSVIHRIFLLMAFMIFVAFVGIMSKNFWIVFTIFYIPINLLLTVIIFRNIEFSCNSSIIKRNILACFKSSDEINIISLRYFVIINLFNVVLAVLGQIEQPSFYFFFLMILVINSGLYMLCHAALKRSMFPESKYKMNIVCGIHTVLAIITWTSAIIIFNFSSLTDWELSPAKSRELNSECVLMNFYDGHDIWHFTSSLGLFFTFIMILSNDDEYNDLSKR